MLNDDALKIGSDWFYPMHFSLNLNWMMLGYWIVGLAALVMLAGLVSGIIIHRKIFREFFSKSFTACSYVFPKKCLYAYSSSRPYILFFQ